MTLQLKYFGYLITALLPSTGISALAAQPNYPSSIAALGLTQQQKLNADALARIRGGFDFGHAFMISFGFKQEESINGIIVKSIEVPTVDLTAAATANTKQATSPLANATHASIQVTDAQGKTQTVTPSAHGEINIATQGNNGLTVINTQLGTSGITNTTTNMANNTSISLAATANIGISGLTQFLNQQQSFASARAGLYYGGSVFK